MIKYLWFCNALSSQFSTKRLSLTVPSKSHQAFPLYLYDLILPLCTKFELTYANQSYQLIRFQSSHVFMFPNHNLFWFADTLYTSVAIYHSTRSFILWSQNDSLLRSHACSAILEMFSRAIQFFSQWSLCMIHALFQLSSYLEWSPHVSFIQNLTH